MRGFQRPLIDKNLIRSPSPADLPPTPGSRREEGRSGEDLVQGPGQLAGGDRQNARCIPIDAVPVRVCDPEGYGGRAARSRGRAGPVEVGPAWRGRRYRNKINIRKQSRHRREDGYQAPPAVRSHHPSGVSTLPRAEGGNGFPSSMRTWREGSTWHCTHVLHASRGRSQGPLPPNM